MELGEKEIRRYSIIFLLLALAVLVYITVKPVAFAVIWGLIFAYVFFPLYSKVKSYVREKNTAASIVSLIVIIIILVPLWFIVPIMVQQVFEIFRFSQTVDSVSIIKALFPSGSEQFVNQLAVTSGTLISKASTAILSFLVNFFMDLPTLLIDLFIAAFVFFFALRDSDKLSSLMSAISPFNKEQQFVLVKQFRDVTDSLIYGQIIVGVVQGILAGLGFLMFGVPNALVLTILAIIFSVIPFIGPSIIWIPMNIYLFTSGGFTLAIAYLAYNLLIVSTFDNILRSYIISKKTNMSSVVSLVGMLGGFVTFGLIGLLIGPLILAYFITFLRAYKDKALARLFAE